MSAPRPSSTSPRSSKFGNLLALVGAVAALDRVLDAMRHVIAQDFFLRTAQRRAYG
jgi:hypothetical protein